MVKLAPAKSIRGEDRTGDLQCVRGSLPSAVKFFTTRRHRVRVIKEVDLLGSARASSNLVDVAFFLVTKGCFLLLSRGQSPVDLPP